MLVLMFHRGKQTVVIAWLKRSPHTYIHMALLVPELPAPLLVAVNSLERILTGERYTALRIGKP